MTSSQSLVGDKVRSVWRNNIKKSVYNLDPKNIKEIKQKAKMYKIPKASDEETQAHNPIIEEVSLD